MKTRTATIAPANGRGHPITVKATYEYEPSDPWDRNVGPGGAEGVEIEDVRIGGIPAALTAGQYERLEGAILERIRDERHDENEPD